MTSGNGMVDGVDKAYDDKFASCSCGRNNFDEVRICEYDEKLECDKDKCNSGAYHNKKHGCKSKLFYVCSDCGYKMEV